MEKNDDSWFETWVDNNDVYDKDTGKATNSNNVPYYRPFQETGLNINDFPSHKKTKKFYTEDIDSLDKWLNKNEVFDKDKTLKDEEVWKFPPENLHSIRIDSVIDLHRLTVSQAINSLNQFILRSFKQNDSVVKVIHGKGNHSKMGPKLKISVIKWLSNDGKGYINFFKEASANHGGSGATIVWLK
ncbi:MAG: Smr/MutS family protein [Spirochaetota bacterium]|nr:Smr/MutS family protein [Spirochaetota bacterium]